MEKIINLEYTPTSSNQFIEFEEKIHVRRNVRMIVTAYDDSGINLNSYDAIKSALGSKNVNTKILNGYLQIKQKQKRHREIKNKACELRNIMNINEMYTSSDNFKNLMNFKLASRKLKDSNDKNDNFAIFIIIIFIII